VWPVASRNQPHVQCRIAEDCDIGRLNIMARAANRTVFDATVLDVTVFDVTVLDVTAFDVTVLDVTVLDVTVLCANTY
jgi:hypothetical protein